MTCLLGVGHGIFEFLQVLKTKVPKPSSDVNCLEAKCLLTNQNCGSKYCFHNSFKLTKVLDGGMVIVSDAGVKHDEVTLQAL